MPENTPHSVAAGIIYFITQSCNLNISKHDVNLISEISEVTINKCYKKLVLLQEDRKKKAVLEQVMDLRAQVENLRCEIDNLRCEIDNLQHTAYQDKKKWTRVVLGLKHYFIKKKLTKAQRVNNETKSTEMIPSVILKKYKA